MADRTEHRGAYLLATVAAGVAGALVVVLVMGASFALLIPAGLGVGLVSLIATSREHSHDEQHVQS